MEKEKTADYGNGKRYAYKRGDGTVCEPMKEYFKKPTETSGIVLFSSFLDEVVKKSFVQPAGQNDSAGSLGSIFYAGFDEEKYFENAAAFWDKVVISVIIDTEKDFLRFCYVIPRKPEDADDDMSELFDTEKVASLMTRFEKTHPEKSVDRKHRLHKIGEIHVPKKEKNNETI